MRQRYKRAVLGIDAAWTVGQPSGVALAAECSDGWHLLAVESSYQRFHARSTGSVKPEERPSGSQPCASVLLEAARSLCGVDMDLVAVDMPLSREPIRGRRAADNEVSRAYGGRKCATHTPSAERPGPISDQLREAFEAAGYRLLTTDVSTPGLIEVYPHPTLVELAGALERLKYKVSKSRAYWPSLSPSERRIRLYEQWSQIVDLLDAKIVGVAAAFQGFESATRGFEMKATEDALDAVVCTWTAICALTGRAVPYGDETSAIWI